MHKLICSVGMMIVALLAGGLAARGQGPLQFDSLRALTEVNQPTSFLYSPWLSADGLHLQYVRLDATAPTGQSVMSARRASLRHSFGLARPVAGLNQGYSASVHFSDDGLTATGQFIANGNPFLGYATRANDSAAFSLPRPLTMPIPIVWHSDRVDQLSITPDGQQLFLIIFSVDDPNRLLQYQRSGVDSFQYVRELPVPAECNVTGAYLCDQGRQLVVSVDSSFRASASSLYRYRRATSVGTFGPPEPIQLPGGQLPSSQQNYTSVLRQPHYRPEVDLLVFAVRPASVNSDLWIAEVSSLVQGTVPASVAAVALSLTPNPAHHTVRLTGLPPGAATAHVIDALGRVVLTSDLAPLTSNLSLTGLPPGLYTVRVGAAARRLVVE